MNVEIHRTKPARAAAGACLAILLPMTAAAIPGKAVLLQGLDKVTARTVTIEAAIGETFRFGSLEIIVRACDRTPPTEPPESAVFLDIVEVKAGEPKLDIFHGWMFSSSPALNALEHPVYDVWALECLSDLPSSSGPDFPIPRPKPIVPG